MPQRKLLDQVSDVVRLRHLSLRTEETRPELEAIIITVMVLEIKLPHGRDLVALRSLTVFAAPPPDVRKCLRPSERRPPKLLGLRPASPFDEINIDHQRLILDGTSLPDSRAGPAVINGPLNQSRAHWIQMNVVDLLHKR